MHALTRMLVLTVALSACAVPTLAHDAPLSYLDLNLLDDRIEGTLVVHVIDAANALDIEPPDALLDEAGARAAATQLHAFLAARMELEAGGTRLSPEWQAVEVLAEQQAIMLLFSISIERPGALAVRAHFFPYDPAHQTFVNVYEFGDIRQQTIFTAESSARTYFSGTTQGNLAVLGTFIPSGVEHILIGPDHILFLIGLLLLGGHWKVLLKIVTAFTVGHSVTLSLAALNIVVPPSQFIEPAIALSIVFVGADNLVRGEGQDVRSWIALVFGLVHGFGFANVLRDFGLPREALGWSLFSFNVGVEIGQVAIVVVVATLLALVRQKNAAIAARVATAGSVVVILAGTYWFVERVFFTGGV